jgi:hypothetical protein
MGKITVKHYLNTNLKPYIMGGELYYKVYFLLRYQNQNTKIKSLVNLEITEIEYSEIISDESNLMNIRLKNEIAFIENIIRTIERENIIFDFKVFNDFLKVATYPIIAKFQEYLKWMFERIDRQSINNEYERMNFKVFEYILMKLKTFVISSPLCITDDIYFSQLFDAKIIEAIETSLKEKQVIKIWRTKEKSLKVNIADDHIIRIEYEQYTVKTIRFLIDTLFEFGGFQLNRKECSTASTGDDYIYIDNIIRSLSGI